MVKQKQHSTDHFLLDWAIAQYRQGLKSFSELTDETGLAVEEIMTSMDSYGRKQAIDAFLASCRTVADAQNNPDFLRMATAVAKALAV